MPTRNQAAKGASRVLPPLNISPSAQKLNSRCLNHRIAAEVAAAAVAAEIPSPNRIELLDKRFDKRRVICQDAVLEISHLLALRAHSGAGEVVRTEVRLRAVDDDALEMHARAEHSLGLLRPLRGSFASLIRPT